MRNYCTLALRVDYGMRHFHQVFVPLTKPWTKGGCGLSVPIAARIAQHVNDYREQQLSFDIRGPWAIHDDLRAKK